MGGDDTAIIFPLPTDCASVGHLDLGSSDALYCDIGLGEATYKILLVIGDALGALEEEVGVVAFAWLLLLFIVTCCSAGDCCCCCCC